MLKISTNSSVTLQTKWNWVRSKKLSCSSNVLVMAILMLKWSCRGSNSSGTDSSQLTTSPTIWPQVRVLGDSSNRCVKITNSSFARAQPRRGRVAIRQVRVAIQPSMVTRFEHSSRSIAATQLEIQAPPLPCRIQASLRPPRPPIQILLKLSKWSKLSLEWPLTGTWISNSTGNGSRDHFPNSGYQRSSKRCTGRKTCTNNSNKTLIKLHTIESWWVVLQVE